LQCLRDYFECQFLLFKNVCARVYVLVRAKISGRTPMRFGVSNREKSVVDVSVRLDDTSKRLPVSRRCRGKSGGGGGGGGGWLNVSNEREEEEEESNRFFLSATIL
jgi:hypothetical protein